MCLIKFLVIGLLVALMGLFFYSMPVRALFRFVPHPMSPFPVEFFFVPISIPWEGNLLFGRIVIALFLLSLYLIGQYFNLVGWLDSASALLFSPLPLVFVDTKKNVHFGWPPPHHRFIKTGCCVTIGLLHFVVLFFPSTLLSFMNFFSCILGIHRQEDLRSLNLRHERSLFMSLLFIKDSYFISFLCYF